MMKKRIPEKYDLTDVDIFKIVQNVLGNVEISFGSDRILRINTTPTHEQLLQIKTDLLNAVEEVNEL